MSISGLGIGVRALQANQIALEITGQNIANVNTPGYTRQRAHLVETESLLKSFGALGTGVKVDGIERIRDAFIDLEIRGQKSSVGSSSIEADMFDRIESIFNEPSSIGINSLLGDFFDSLHDLANSPEDIGIRSTIMSSAQSLAQQISFVNNELDQLRLNINEAVKNTVTEINSLTQQIANLNTEIVKFEAGVNFSANDLRDQRDESLKELAELTNIRAFEQDTGEVNVSISGVNLVFGGTSTDLDTQLQTGDELPIVEVITANTGSVIDFTDGEMYGLLQSRDVHIVDRITMLDELARGLIDQINNIHVDGRGIQGLSSITSVNGVDDSSIALDQTDLDITPVDTTFDIVVLDTSTDPCQMTGVNISVDVDVDSLDDVATNINTALTAAGITEITASVNANNQLEITSSDTDFVFSLGNVTDNISNFLSSIGLDTFFTGTDASDIAVNDFIVNNPEFIAAQALNSGTQVDNTNALLMAELRQSKVMNSGTQTLEEFYQTAIVQLGSDTQSAHTTFEANDAFLTQLILKRESISGVNLDEEAANLIKFQRAYEASARYISVIDQILNVLVNGLI